MRYDHKYITSYITAYLRVAALTRRARSGPAIGTMSGAGARLGTGARLRAGGGLRLGAGGNTWVGDRQWISAGGFCTSGVSMLCVLVLLNSVVSCSAAARETSADILFRKMQNLVA